MEALPLAERLAMDRQWQAHWYRHVGGLAAGKSVLDVGAGTGYGLPILRAAGAVDVLGFDIVEIGPEVRQSNVDNYPDSSWDVVTAIDVIEHVEDDRTFLAHLLRISRTAAFISTPNWNVSKAANPYHVREYAPQELEELLEGLDYRIWVSNHELVVTTRGRFDPAETWHNFGVWVGK